MSFLSRFNTRVSSVETAVGEAETQTEVKQTLPQKDEPTRVKEVIEVFSGLGSLFSPSQPFRDLSDGSRRVWLHHINGRELGGGIIDNKLRARFSWARGATADILTIDDHVAKTGLIEYVLSAKAARLDVHHGADRVLSPEVRKRGIESLESISRVLGELANSQTVAVTIS